MKQILTLDFVSLHLLYYRYKSFFVPSLVILISMVLLMLVIPREVQNIYVAKEASSILQKKIDTILKNYTLLSGLQDSVLDENLTITSLALPPEKDFQAVLQAISDSAAKANVTVDDYGLDIGDFSQNSKGELPQISVSLSVKGQGVNSITTFISSLQKEFPLSEVGATNINGGSGSVNVSFFFRSSPILKGDRTILLRKLSKEEEKLLEILKTWKS